MRPTVFQRAELRDENDNIVQQGTYGKGSALSNSTNDGWVDYVMNNLEFLYGLAKDEVVPVSALPASGDMNKTYLLTTNGKTYRWSGTAWVELTNSEAVGRAETAANLAEQWATKTNGAVADNEYSAKYYANSAQQSADDAQDVADDMADHLAQIDQNTGGVSANSKRIGNIEKLLQGNLYDYQTDSTSAYTKSVPQGAMPYASLDSIGGKTLVWNQLIKPNSIANRGYISSVGLTLTNNNNGSFTVDGTSSNANNLYFYNTLPIINGHKYFVATDKYSTNGEWSISIKGYVATTANGATIITSMENTNAVVRFNFNANVTFNNLTIYLKIVDLTLGFGTGNEPTAEEFNAMFPNFINSNVPYNAGTLLSAGVTEVVSYANLLANEILEQGAITTAGDVTPANNRVRTSNFIQVEPNTQYEATTTSQGINVLGIYYYSDLTTFVSRDVTESKDYIFTTSSTTNYLKITYSKTDDSNLVPSDVSPVLLHKIATYPIPASIQALEGYGWSAGSAHNYIDFERKVFVKNVGRIVVDGVNRKVSSWGSSYPGKFFISFITRRFAISDRFILSYAVQANMPQMTFVGGSGTDTTWNFSLPTTITTTAEGNAWFEANPTTIYYPLNTPIETDISEYLTDDNLIEVEAGGTLTFPNSNGDDYQIPVPSEETYMIDLQEAIQ